MLSCISFHYYSIASDELAVISTSGCYCFLWNKHLLIFTGQTIYGKVHKKFPDKIQTNMPRQWMFGALLGAAPHSPTLKKIKTNFC